VLLHKEIILQLLSQVGTDAFELHSFELLLQYRDVHLQLELSLVLALLLQEEEHQVVVLEVDAEAAASLAKIARL